MIEINTPAGQASAGEVALNQTGAKGTGPGPGEAVPAGEPMPAGENRDQDLGTDAREQEIPLWTASSGGLSVTADAFAITEGDQHSAIWFISMVGAQAALRAVWASLLNMPPKPVYLTPGTEGLALDGKYHHCLIPPISQGTWKVRMNKMANGVGHHAMAYTAMAEYSFDNEIFVLLARDGENEQEAHHRFLDRRVTLPMHPSWAGWLWDRGLDTEEIIPMECQGIRAWLCAPNPPKLEAEVGRAIRQRLIGI